MKKDVLDILACPVCKGCLQLTVTDEKHGEIIAGNLYCEKCKETYPIIDNIPNLLPPDIR